MVVGRKIKMVSIEIKEYTKNLIPDVIDFENRLRQEENFWGWEIDDKYVSDVYQSFDSTDFQNS